MRAYLASLPANAEMIASPHEPGVNPVQLRWFLTSRDFTKDLVRVLEARVQRL